MSWLGVLALVLALIVLVLTGLGMRKNVQREKRRSRDRIP